MAIKNLKRTIADEKQTVRRRTVGKLTIYFYSSEELIVITPYSTILFHQWFTRNKRKTFRQFRKSLMYQKNFDLSDIFRMAQSKQVEYLVPRFQKQCIEDAIRNNEVVELRPEGRVSNVGVK